MTIPNILIFRVLNNLGNFNLFHYFLFSGLDCHFWGFYWCCQYSRAVVSGVFGLAVQLPSLHAHPCSDCCIPDAPRRCLWLGLDDADQSRRDPLPSNDLTMTALWDKLKSNFCDVFRTKISTKKLIHSEDNITKKLGSQHDICCMLNLIT